MAKPGRKEEREITETGGGRECKSGRDRTMVERTTVVLAPAAGDAKSVQCETFGSYSV